MDNFVKQLLHPLSQQDFFSTYFEKKHLHIESKQSDRFSDILSFETLDSVLGQHALDSNSLRVVNSEKEFDVSQYTWNRGKVDAIKVAKFFAEGATIIFNHLQNHVSELNELCNNISTDINRKTQTNIYLTPANSQGFKTHWDTHDVFIMQVEGSKVWKIYKEHFKFPFDPDKHGFEPGVIDANNIIDEFVLNAGDILYIPRGIMHSASSTDSKSLHITFGIMPYTITEVVRDCLDIACEDIVDWRSEVPYGVKSESDLRELITQKMTDIVNDSTLAKALKRHDVRVKSNHRPFNSHYLQEAINPTKLKFEDRILPYKHAQIHIVESDDKTKLHLDDGEKEIILPITAKKTIDLIFKSSDLKIGDFDDDVDWQSRKVVISKVLKEGFAYRKRA